MATLARSVFTAARAGRSASKASNSSTRISGGGPDWPAAYSLLVGVHDASTYLLLALTAGHVAMALKHALVERDGIFARIAP